MGNKDISGLSRTMRPTHTRTFVPGDCIYIPHGAYNNHTACGEPIGKEIGQEREKTSLTVVKLPENPGKSSIFVENHLNRPLRFWPFCGFRK